VAIMQNGLWTPGCHEVPRAASVGDDLLQGPAISGGCHGEQRRFAAREQPRVWIFFIFTAINEKNSG
jgi:hypothetical protein